MTKAVCGEPSTNNGRCWVICIYNTNCLFTWIQYPLEALLHTLLSQLLDPLALQKQAASLSDLMGPGLGSTLMTRLPSSTVPSSTPSTMKKVASWCGKRSKIVMVLLIVTVMTSIRVLSRLE